MVGKKRKKKKKKERKKRNSHWPKPATESRVVYSIVVVNSIRLAICSVVQFQHKAMLVHRIRYHCNYAMGKYKVCVCVCQGGGEGETPCASRMSTPFGLVLATPLAMIQLKRRDNTCTVHVLYTHTFIKFKCVFAGLAVICIYRYFF